MPGNHRCHATHGTLHLGIAQVVAGVHLLGLGLCQGSLSLQQGVLHGLHRHVGHHATFLQQPLVVVVHLGCCQTGLGTLTSSHRHLKGCAIGHLVDDKQRLPFLHGLALARQDAGDAARHLRTHLYNLLTRQTRRVLSLEHHIFLAHHHGLVVSSLLLSLLLLLATRGTQRHSHTHSRQHQPVSQKSSHIIIFVFVGTKVIKKCVTPNKSEKKQLCQGHFFFMPLTSWISLSLFDLTNSFIDDYE